MTTRTKTPAGNGKTDVKLHAPRKLDIACGQRKQKGYKGIDLAGDADIVHDLFDFPWPIKTSSVEEVFCSHFVEHIPHSRAEWGHKDGWFMFFDELHRVMKPDATAFFEHPYVFHGRGFWDPTHVRYIHEQTWYYLSKDWRDVNLLDHYGVEGDFEIVNIAAVGLSDEFQTRNAEMQNFSRVHYINIIPDLQVRLRAIK